MGSNALHCFVDRTGLNPATAIPYVLAMCELAYFIKLLHQVVSIKIIIAYSCMLFLKLVSQQLVTVRGTFHVERLMFTLIVKVCNPTCFIFGDPVTFSVILQDTPELTSSIAFCRTKFPRSIYSRSPALGYRIHHHGNSKTKVIIDAVDASILVKWAILPFFPDHHHSSLLVRRHQHDSMGLLFRKPTALVWSHVAANIALKDHLCSKNGNLYMQGNHVQDHVIYLSLRH